MVDEIAKKKIVCLGGGIGTSNLLRGLKKYNPQITVITSMADDGGSTGRLRKAYKIMPPGDIISCIAALTPENEKELANLLIYRLPGNDKTNTAIGGHKLGNIIMLAEIYRTGDFYKAIEATKRMCHVTADFFPATDERTRLYAITNDGRRVHGETTLDLALYSEPHGIEQIGITPKKPKVNKKVIDALMNADVIISGPGDLYTNQLPVLIVPEIKEALLKSTAQKIFILNTTNKPIETKGYMLEDFVKAITRHLGQFPFDTVIANNNQTVTIPKNYHYEYVPLHNGSEIPYKLVEADLINEDFPIYHNPNKLATVIAKQV